MIVYFFSKFSKNGFQIHTMRPTDLALGFNFDQARFDFVLKKKEIA